MYAENIYNFRYKDHCILPCEFEIFWLRERSLLDAHQSIQGNS